MRDRSKVYNYRDLVPSARSDGEVLLPLYEKQGSTFPRSWAVFPGENREERGDTLNIPNLLLTALNTSGFEILFFWILRFLVRNPSSNLS